MLQKQFMASWVTIFLNQLETQLSLQAEPFITFQFSSIGLDGFPSSRTVVYRGFLFNDESNNIITFTTDKRMDKYQQLLQNDKFEAVFYFNHVKTQFRFKGHAKVIDSEHKPLINLNNIQPRSVGESYDDEEDHEEDQLQLNLNKMDISASQKPKTCQKSSIDYNLISPTLVNTNDNGSSLNLAELNIHPPTNEEYDIELQRQWDNLSKNLKKSFRKPPPKSLMTPELSKKIDSINRGVDGKKDIDGFKNFSLVGLFIDHVDYYDGEHEKRYISERDEYDLWKETEVCP
ncbi:uncharacterized protein CLIB1444_02S17832 [[Candida] jaroonii]|uniref:Uncharacterized protein n=1 Tax=[Candida] jaroonii TaxID=467808 RepID=A0ACA9Y4H4_9ASCO|nr:uncharacterized protein CLIB1444_02S17832 [[Candida] jaroonii]